MGLIDKDDVGLAVGGGLGAIVAASMGAGPVGIAVTTIIGAYGGHKLSESAHYKPIYQYR